MKQRLAQISWVWVLIGWTVFQWLSRLRNVLNDEDLSSSGRAIRVGVVVVFLVFAGAAAWVMRRGRERTPGPQVLAFFLAWTVGYWLVRGIGILIDGEYSVGFKAIHTVLMAISLSLSFLAARQLRLRR